jgi:hypothetical protein
MIEIADADKSGSIDFQEFISLMKTQTMTQVSEDVLRDAFSQFDTSGTGRIPAAEFREVFLFFLSLCLIIISFLPCLPSSRPSLQPGKSSRRRKPSSLSKKLVRLSRFSFFHAFSRIFMIPSLSNSRY